MTLAQMQALFTAAGLLLIALAVLGGGLVLAGEIRVRSVRRSRFGGVGSQGETVAREGGLTAPLTAAARRLGQKSAVRDPAKLTVLRSKLIQAGYFNREAPVIFLGARAAALIAATVGALVSLPLVASGGAAHGTAVAGAFALAALLGPDQILNARRKTREREYTEGFPDLLDLLVASVEAGLSLDAAVSRCTDELVRRYPNLVIHLRFLVLELRAGRVRKDAWSAFAERLGIEDARALATMLRQAEDMGTSLGETLTVFSQDMRAKRMLRAEEKALALPAKLTVPLILFIFPCLLGVLMLPAVARLMKVFAG